MGSDMDMEEILVLYVGAINYNSRAQKIHFYGGVYLMWWSSVDFPCLFRFAADVCVFNYEQLAGEKFVSLQLPVFYFSLFISAFWRFLFVLGIPLNEIPLLSAWIQFQLEFLLVDFWSMQSEFTFYINVYIYVYMYMFLFLFISGIVARACRIGFRIIFIILGHWQFLS